MANCRTDEGHPQSGDQGQEIRLQGYWNYPWDCCLRYKGDNSDVPTPTEDPVPAAPRTNLRKGMQGDDVKELQQNLNALGYDCGEADGIFGNKTFRAVILFQEDHWMEADGIAGRQTKEAIKADLEKIATDMEPPEPAKSWLPDLEQGDKGNEVIFLQAALNLLDFFCGNADGIFGAKTTAALNRFKEDVGLKPDGKVDAETWHELLEVMKG